MIDIEEYIQLPKSERQKHLKLDEACLERGGYSAYYKGILAHVLDTTIPYRCKTVQLCHACNNPECSNPNHLYFGTNAENCQDAFANGALNCWQRMVNKYGLEEATAIQSRKGRVPWNKKNNVAIVQ